MTLDFCDLDVTIQPFFVFRNRNCAGRGVGTFPLPYLPCVIQGCLVHYYPVGVSHSGLVTGTVAAALARCGVGARRAACTVLTIVRHMLECNCKVRIERKNLTSQLQYQLKLLQYQSIMLNGGTSNPAG